LFSKNFSSSSYNSIEKTFSPRKVSSLWQYRGRCWQRRVCCP